MIQLQIVTEQEEPILQNLLQFYIYEFSQFAPQITLEADGTYQPFPLEKYWSDPRSHAFFILYQEELVGLALIAEGTASDPSTVEQFFIIRKYMGRGFGKEAAVQLFNHFPGKWKIWQIEKNEPARTFWRKVISGYTNGNYTESPGEERRTVQEFETGR